MSSFRASVFASYASQIYIALVGIVLMPVYLRLMGAEAYGLVAFFTVLQAWFQLLDFGLSPTLARECARFHGGATDALALRRLVRALELIFLVLGCSASIGLAVGADWIASNWIKADSLPVEQIALCVQLMAATIAMRWMSGLYRGALGGLEQLVWLGGFNVAVATARFVLVVPVLQTAGATPIVFFVYQVLVATVELLALAWRTYARLPRIAPRARVGLHLMALRERLGFSLSIAFTGAVWVAVTQTDKLILSKMLPLADYAHFTLAVLLASGVTIISGPLSAALLPRLSRLYAEGASAEAINLYRQATQGMALAAGTLALVLAAAAEPVLFAWTGDRALAHSTAPLLQFYALGNGILALSAFPYYLQFAKGDVRLHLVGNAIFLVVLVPSIVFATVRSGAVGAGMTWLIANLLYATLWVPLVHRKFAPGIHVAWLTRDVATILVPAGLAASILATYAPSSGDRLLTGALVALVAAGVLMAAMPFSSLVRTKCAQWRSVRLAAVK